MESYKRGQDRAQSLDPGEGSSNIDFSYDKKLYMSRSNRINFNFRGVHRGSALWL